MDSAFPIWWFGVFGLIVGSFLNVLVLRLRSGEAWMGGRSKCPRCGHTLAWYDNIPLASFVWLRGRCRHCREPISWQYPLVELGTALLFIATAAAFDSWRGGGSWSGLAGLLVLQGALLVVFVYDLLHMEIPLGPWGVGVAVSPFVLYAMAGESGVSFEGALIGHLAAGLAGAAFLGGLSWISRERWMGWGDAYLIFLLGAVVGFPGVLWIVTLGSGLGALIGVGLILLGKRALGSRLPFGPFLIAGFWLVLLWPRFFPDTPVAGWLTGWL